MVRSAQTDTTPEIAESLAVLDAELANVESIAAIEREMMLERQREGAKAKRDGKYRGRKPTACAKSVEVKALASQGVWRRRDCATTRDRAGLLLGEYSKTRRSPPNGAPMPLANHSSQFANKG
jgi:DNA invertase Pin-like site-specific DNA recombinase